MKLNELNWLSSLLNLLMLPFSFWLFKSKLFLMCFKIYLIIYKEILIILNNKFNSFNLIYLISLMFYIYINNIMGLFPYIFTSSSHMIFSISLSIPMWISLMIFGWMKNMDFMYSHLAPQGTPMFLLPFMVMIETISNIIRPMTLTIRLTANMIAGHLLMTLMSETATNKILLVSMPITLIQIILLILEFSVSIIQAYVFTILMTLYIKETN